MKRLRSLPSDRGIVKAVSDVLKSVEYAIREPLMKTKVTIRKKGKRVYFSITADDDKRLWDGFASGLGLHVDSEVANREVRRIRRLLGRGERVTKVL